MRGGEFPAGSSDMSSIKCGTSSPALGILILACGSEKPLYPILTRGVTDEIYFLED